MRALTLVIGLSAMATVFANINRAAQTEPAYDPGQPLGSIANPYAHPKDAEAAHVPGQAFTCLIRGGAETGGVDYTSQFPDTFQVEPVHDVEISGTSGARVTFEAYDPVNEPVEYDGELSHNECVRIEFQQYVTYRNITVKEGRERLFRVQDSDYINVIGIKAHDNLDTIGGSPSNLPGIVIGSRAHYCVVEFCEVWNCGRGIVLQGSVTNGVQTDPDEGARYCIVRHCYCHDNTQDAGDGDGIQAFGAKDNEIIDCIVANNGDDGVDLAIGSHRTTVRRIVAYGHTGAGAGNGRGIVAGVWGNSPEGDGIGGAADCSLEYCLTFDNQFGIYNAAVNLTVNHCTSVFNTKNGITHDEDELNDSLCTVINSIFYGNLEKDIHFNFARANPIALANWIAIGDLTSHNDHSDVSGQELNALTQISDPFVNSADRTANPAAVLAGGTPDVPGLHLAEGSALLTAGQGGTFIGAYGEGSTVTVANFMYNHVPALLWSGQLNLGSDTFEAMLLDQAHTPNPDITAIDTGGDDANDPSANEPAADNYAGGFGGASRLPVTMAVSADNTNDRGQLVINDLTWPTLGGTNNAFIRGAIIYKRGTDDTDSLPLFFLEGNNAPTDGSDFPVDLDNVTGITFG